MRPWLELIRLPAVFTAPADVLAGLALAGAAGAVLSPVTVVLAVLASAFVYCAGMAANDLFDAGIDAQERPGRPIPSGRVSRRGAWTLVVGLQAAAVALAVVIHAIPAVLATIGATYLYNAALKDGPLGPLAMGLCRYANALIGVTAVAGLAVPWWVLAVPATTLIYVAALTTVSRYEVDGAEARGVRGPALALSLGAALVAGWAFVLPVTWAAALVVVPLAWLWRPLRGALAEPSAARVRGLVMAGIFGIAMVNAVIAAMAGGWWQAGVALGLLVPGRLVGRWFYAT